MTYEIIKDCVELKRFIDWLPELEPHEIYYVSLIARKKYDPECPSLRSDKQQLKRFTATKDWLYRKIAQLECKFGAYENRDGTPVSQKALALYINVNPRSQVRATKNSVTKLVGLATEKYSGYNPHQIVMSEIQKAKSKSRYLDMDFDGVEVEDTLPEVLRYINKESVNVLKTRGGFHLLIELDKVDKKFKKTWHQNLRTLSGCDVLGDNMIPIPGCTQGDFVPYLTKL